MNLHTPIVLPRCILALHTVGLDHDTDGAGRPLVELDTYTESEIRDETEAALAQGLTGEDAREYVFERFDLNDNLHARLVCEAVDGHLWADECARKVRA